MARLLRLEEEGGLYHVINRGNYRAHIFRAEKTKAAFLKCLGEACEKTGWVVHAWCLMSNHYHLALETPAAILVDGMRWLQGTFSTRFNRLRKENGHLFQGRYKSLLVDPAGGLGSLCHYIHLNPVRAKVCSIEELSEWRWSSMRWLSHPKERRPWYDPRVALGHAWTLADTAAGRRRYVKYLDFLNEDEVARKEFKFDEMSKGWAIGSNGFQKDLLKEHRNLVGSASIVAAGLTEAREAGWKEECEGYLRRLGRTTRDVKREGKSVAWKLAVAAAMKARTTVTNRWLAEHLEMGNMYEVSRKVAHWLRNPDPALAKKLKLTPNPKA
jgi:REP element-mobilizing transposase RayT